MVTMYNVMCPLTAVWTICVLFVLIISTHSNMLILSSSSNLSNVVSMAMNVPVRPAPALDGRRELVLIR